MTVLFISDLHLSSDHPEIKDQFLGFLANEARAASRLYVLGDLFEAWIGDDDPDPHHADVQQALAEFSAQNSNTRCYFMHGNRDFLIGEQFAERTGFEILADPVVHDVYGTQVLLSHGDQYCTDDHEYMATRQMVRNPEWQRQVLSRSIAERQALAGAARAESQQANATKSMEIMDVNADAVDRALLEADVAYLLHGHTHRPAVHDLTRSDGQSATRAVLGDWYEHGSVGVWDESGFSLEQLSRIKR
ncbi:MAG: UDP-2,3-diacylglucosamine diphosphatase [Pseudomonadota bacterium]